MLIVNMMMVLIVVVVIMMLVMVFTMIRMRMHSDVLVTRASIVSQSIFTAQIFSTISMVMVMVMVMVESAVHSGINPHLMCNENLQ